MIFSPRAATFPLLLGVLGAFGARPALAAERTCATFVVDADEGVRRLWPELPGRVHDAFDGRDDVDGCARVTLSAVDAAIVVRVLLPDGRSTSRSVAQPVDVVPMLEALLLEPARDEAPVTPEPAAAPLVVARTAPPATVRDARPAAPTPSALRIELSVATGARIGDGQTSVGIGALSFLDVSGWLIGFSGRADRYQPMSDATPIGALELALLAGRRFRFGTFSLDFIAGPAIALQGTTKVTTQAGAGAPLVDRPTAREDMPRLVLGMRLSFGARSTFRTFIALDGNVSPGHLSSNPQVEEPGIPLWTLGIALGATVGTR